MGSLGQRQERIHAGLHRGNGGSVHVRERTGWAEVVRVGLLSWAGKPAASGRKGDRERFGPSGCWLLGWIGFSYFSGFPFLSLSNHTQTI